MSRLSRIILTVRRGFDNGGEAGTASEGISSAVHFYNQCIGLPIHRVTQDSAELVLSSSSIGQQQHEQEQQQQESFPDTSLHMDNNNQNNHSNNIILTIRAIDGDESKLCTGYTPIITFEVQSIDTIISNCIQYGAQLDGPIQYPAYGKIASLRTPHGHIISLYEPTT
jgi:hypothetical protein